MAPCGPASGQEQRSRRRAEPAAAVGLVTGLYLVWKMDEGPLPGPNPCYTTRVHYPLLSLFVGASSTTERLNCQALRRQTQSNRWSRRRPSPVKNSEINKSAVRLAPLSQGFCGARAEAKTVSAAGEIDPRPVQPSVVATEAETLATNLPGEAERPSTLIRGSCVRKS